MTTRTCKQCGDDVPIEQFRVQSGYRIWTCNCCITVRTHTNAQREKNRQVAALLRWPVPASAPADDPGHPSPGDTSLAVGALDLNGGWS